MSAAPILPLKLEGVVFAAGRQLIIDRVTLDIAAGPSTIILGANGAGKSVLMRLMHGLLEPTSGSLRWSEPDRQRARRRQAMVFQRPIMLRRSALANVQFALELAGIPGGEREAQALAALDEVGLRPLAHRPARVLSGGEQQRLALARAWALHPEVLFLDEPTASLDPGATREIETVIKAFDAAGTKIVMATHNLGGGVHQRGSAVGLKAALLSTFLCFSSMAEAQPRYITLASTTSTEQSGLFKHLLPIFEKKTGIQVRVVAVGTGQALDMGRRGDADVALVHDKTAEERFVAEGWYVDRRDVMYNDFVVVGPRYDPARAHGADTAVALKKISAQKAPFASRGDKSGTHAAELRLWQIAGVDPASGKGAWYRETGSGMGPTLNTASAMNAYALADRGTWLSFRNRGNLTILVEGDKRLFNQYGVMLVNPARHPHVKKAEGLAFMDWLVSPEGQKVIADYKINGEQLFFPNAGKA